MRKVFLLVLLLTLSAQAQEAAITHLLDQQATDWNHGNVDAFMTGYENSPQTTFVGQKVEYGYANILTRYRKLYATRKLWASSPSPTWRSGSSTQLCHRHGKFPSRPLFCRRGQCGRHLLPALQKGT